MNNQSPQTFVTQVQQEGNFILIAIPFAPRDVWGPKPRYHVTGSINGCPVRGCLGVQGNNYFLRLGAAWVRDNGYGPGREVTVCLAPEGPQADALAPDLSQALANDSVAQAFFDALPTFYRKNYIRWVESAKRPETRAKRISEMMGLLAAQKREK